MARPVLHQVGDPGDISSPESLAREGYDRHGAELYRYALSRLGDVGVAEDAVQETILRAWRSGTRYDASQGSLRTWLFAIMRNVVIDQHASRSRHPRVLRDSEGDEGMDQVASDHAEGVAETDLVARALELISHDHRTAIVETYLRDRPYDEVAAELHVPVSTLRSRVFHGLRQLRTAMVLLTQEGESHA